MRETKSIYADEITESGFVMFNVLIIEMHKYRCGHSHYNVRLRADSKMWLYSSIKSISHTVYDEVCVHGKLRLLEISSCVFR